MRSRRVGIASSRARTRRRLLDGSMRAAAEGLRAPVQVMEGNYRLMSGTCAWWDGVKR